MDLVALRDLNPTNPPLWKEFPVDSIFVDASYQQPLDEKWVSYLVDNWDGNAAGALLISVHGDDRAATPDGQHRLAAMRRLGIKFWKCECHYNLTTAEEATLFLSRNNKKVPHILAKFKARVCMGDRKAVEIKAILKEFGVQVGFRDSSPDSTIYNCIGSLEKVYDFGILRETMQLLEHCWSDHGRLARDKMVVDGIVLFLRNFSQNSAFTMNAAIDRISSRVDLKKAKTHSRDLASASGTSQAYQFAKVLWEAYNKGKQTRRLPEILIYR